MGILSVLPENVLTLGPENVLSLVPENVLFLVPENYLLLKTMQRSLTMVTWSISLALVMARLAASWL